MLFDFPHKYSLSIRHIFCYISIIIVILCLHSTDREVYKMYEIIFSGLLIVVGALTVGLFWLSLNNIK